MAQYTWEGYYPLFLGRTSRIGFGTAAPTVGQWDQNSVIVNEAAAAGVPYAWVCTAGGNPGTWLPMNVLANSLAAPRTVAGTTDTIVPATDKVVVYSGGTTVTITLPAVPPAGGVGPIYLINANSGTATLSTSGTLVGLATFATNTSAQIYSNGTNWYRV